jgi:hypothetical protein
MERITNWMKKLDVCRGPGKIVKKSQLPPLY